MVELPLTTFGATGAFLPNFIFHLLKVALWIFYTKNIVVSIYKCSLIPRPCPAFVTSVLQAMEIWVGPGYEGIKCIY